MEKTYPIVLIAFPYLILIAVLSGYIVAEFSYQPFFWLWALNNLLFVSFSEEVFFRGFLQKELTQRLKGVCFGETISLVIASIGFTLVHCQTTVNVYTLLFLLSGLLYGWVYKKTHSIEASIGVHFLLNTLHYLFFTYPMAAL